jgi:hypothetical protein
MNVLTIDADYWFPLEQGGHCGRCPDQGGRLRRVASCKLNETSRRDARSSMDDERTIPTIQQIVEIVGPGTRIKVTESHAEMFFILYRAHLADGQIPYVVNIDEHPDTGWCGGSYTTVTTRGVMRTKHAFRFFYSEGVSEDLVHCGSWVEAAVIGGWFKIGNYRWIGSERSYKVWKASKRGKAFRPDVVHVCRSAPYMSTRGDPHFGRLVRALEQASGRPASIYGHRAKELWRIIRRNDEAQCQAHERSAP